MEPCSVLVEKTPCENISLSNISLVADDNKEEDRTTKNTGENSNNAVKNRKFKNFKRGLAVFWRRVPRDSRLWMRREDQARELWRSIVLWTCLLYLVALIVMGIALSSLPVKLSVWLAGYREVPPDDAFDLF